MLALYVLLAMVVVVLLSPWLLAVLCVFGKNAEKRCR